MAYRSPRGQWVKTSLLGFIVTCHNALGLVRTVCRPNGLGIGPPVLHAPKCIVTTNPSRICLNSLRPRLNRRPFADDIFKCIFLNENEWILPRISLKFVPRVRINNIPALVHIMAWRRPGGKPLSEPMMVSLLTHICVTRPQWVNPWINTLVTTKGQ